MASFLNLCARAAQPYQLVQHYKGGIYKVLSEATALNRKCIVYTDGHAVWVRPSDSFKGTLQVDGQERFRFRPIASHEMHRFTELFNNQTLKSNIPPQSCAAMNLHPGFYKDDKGKRFQVFTVARSAEQMEGINELDECVHYQECDTQKQQVASLEKFLKTVVSRTFPPFFKE